MKNLEDDYIRKGIENDTDKLSIDFAFDKSGDEYINAETIHTLKGGSFDPETEEDRTTRDVELDDFFEVEITEEKLSDFQKEMRLHPENWRFCDPEHGFWREDLAYNYCKENNIPIIEFDGNNFYAFEHFRKFTIEDPTFRYIILGSDTMDYNLYYEECGEDWSIVNRLRKLRNIRNLIMEK